MYSRYDRAAFDRLLAGFSELPELDVAAKMKERSAIPVLPIHITPVSRYEVH